MQLPRPLPLTVVMITLNEAHNCLLYTSPSPRDRG